MVLLIPVNTHMSVMYYKGFFKIQTFRLKKGRKYEFHLKRNCKWNYKVRALDYRLRMASWRSTSFVSLIVQGVLICRSTLLNFKLAVSIADYWSLRGEQRKRNAGVSWQKRELDERSVLLILWLEFPLLNFKTANFDWIKNKTRS